MCMDILTICNTNNVWPLGFTFSHSVWLFLSWVPPTLSVKQFSSSLVVRSLTQNFLSSWCANHKSCWFNGFSRIPNIIFHFHRTFSFAVDRSPPGQQKFRSQGSRVMAWRATLDGIERTLITWQPSLHLTNLGKVRMRWVEERSGNLEFPFKSICKYSDVYKRAIAR